jgi:hypothetical protein
VLPELATKLPTSSVGRHLQVPQARRDEFNEAGLIAPDNQMLTLSKRAPIRPHRSTTATSPCSTRQRVGVPVHDLIAR